MKKLICALLAAGCTLSGIWALDISVGGIADYTHGFRFIKSEKDSYSTNVFVNQNMAGFNGFFDVQFVQLQMGVDMMIGKQRTTTIQKSALSLATNYEDTAVLLTNFNIGVLGKFPFSAGSIKLYPLVGFDFDFPLAGEYEIPASGSTHYMTREELAKANRYWFDAGFGADFYIVKKLFLRPQFLFGWQLNVPEEIQNQKDNAKTSGAQFSSEGMKFNFGLGVGFKF